MQLYNNKNLLCLENIWISKPNAKVVKIIQPWPILIIKIPVPQVTFPSKAH